MARLLLTYADRMDMDHGKLLTGPYRPESRIKTGDTGEAECFHACQSGRSADAPRPSAVCSEH